MRKKWAKDWLLKRETYSHVNVLNEFRLGPGDFKNYLRMNEETHQKLLSMVVLLIKKEDTIMRNSISPHERLMVTLRFLATGRRYEDIKYTAIISPRALGKIIPETYDISYKVLLANCTGNTTHATVCLYSPVCAGRKNRKTILIRPPVQSPKTAETYRTRAPEKLCRPTAQAGLSGKPERIRSRVNIDFGPFGVWFSEQNARILKLIPMRKLIIFKIAGALRGYYASL